VRTRGRLLAGGRLRLAAAHGRRPRASFRDGGRQEPLELHEGRIACPSGPRPLGEGLHAVSGPRDAGQLWLHGGGHVRRVPRRRHGPHHDGRQHGRLRGVAGVRPAVVYGAVHSQCQPLCVRHHEPVVTKGRWRLRPVRYGTVEQRVCVARGPTSRSSAHLRRARAAAAMDRDGRVWSLRKPGSRAAFVRFVRRAQNFLPAGRQRGHVSAHSLRELPVHVGRDSRRTTALRHRATCQTGTGVRQHALRYRTPETGAGEPRGRRRYSFGRTPTPTGRKYEREVTLKWAASTTCFYFL